MHDSKADSYTSFDSAVSEHHAKHHAGRTRDSKPKNIHGEPSSKDRHVPSGPRGR